MRRKMVMLTLAVLAASLIGSGCRTGSGNGSGATDVEPYKGGFVTAAEDGRLWVFRSDSADLEQYRKMGDVPKRVTRVRGGPRGLTVLAPDFETIDAFMAQGEAATWAAVPTSLKRSSSPTVSNRPVPAQPVAVPNRPALPTGKHARPGFQTVEKDGRLWVFEAGSENLSSFLSGKEPAKHVTMVRAGPGGVTLKGIEPEVLQGYVASRPGFVTEIVDGRIWVFRPGSQSLADFRRIGEPAKHVIRPSAGPMRMTVKGEDFETVDEYLTTRPGFVSRVQDGRLWVFRPGSQALSDYDTKGEPAKHVTQVRAGPRGMTIKAADDQTIREYMATADGFETEVVDGRIWVFLSGSEDWQDYQAKGAPAKHITFVRAGPMSMTVKAPDETTANLYLRQVMP